MSRLHANNNGFDSIIICIAGTYPEKRVRQKEYIVLFGLSNPTISNGVTTWDCIYFTKTTIKVTVQQKNRLNGESFP